MIFGGVFSELRDRRGARGKRYGLEPFLCAIVLSMLAGANSLRKTSAFMDERLGQLNSLLGTNWRKAPSWVGIRGFLLGIDENELESAIRTHADRVASPPPGRQFIAIDGKALRGSASRVLDIPARQLVSAFDHDDLIVLGHVDVSDKSNEIPAAQALIESMGLPGRVFTLDALHCQKKTLAIASAKGADVLVQVKANQPTLLAACEDLARHCTPMQWDVQHDKGHGRIETRSVHTFDLPPNWLPDGWQPLVRQVVRVCRTVERRKPGGWHTTDETAWWISTTALSAAVAQSAIRGHWHVENQNHHVRDVTLREDHCRARHKPGVLARLRSMTLNCLRAQQVRNVAVALHRNAMNFERARGFAQATRNI
jgi:predicted transposase YbfD/YdcC